VFGPQTEGISYNTEIEMKKGKRGDEPQQSLDHRNRLGAKRIIRVCITYPNEKNLREGRERSVASTAETQTNRTEKKTEGEENRPEITIFKGKIQKT